MLLPKQVSKIVNQSSSTLYDYVSGKTCGITDIFPASLRLFTFFSFLLGKSMCFMKEYAKLRQFYFYALFSVVQTWNKSHPPKHSA